MIESLTALLSPDRVLTGDVHLAAYESDGLTAFRAKPRAVVVPEPGGAGRLSQEDPCR